jgi:heat-inducible transcriptional repressor
MQPRQEQLLKLVIEQHIETAEPIGSRFLVSEGDLEWSEATVRNDLRALEEEGFLTHPHTSAGRVPTAQGYQYYLSTIDWSDIDIPKKDFQELESNIEQTEQFEQSCKTLTKTLVQLSHEMALFAFSRDSVYYTGLSELLEKPEFAELERVVNFSKMFDRCEEFLNQFIDRVAEEPKCFIGEEHPFGPLLSVVAVRVPREEKIMALLGPMRMDYVYNVGLLKKAAELVDNL